MKIMKTMNMMKMMKGDKLDLKTAVLNDLMKFDDMRRQSRTACENEKI